MKTVEATGILRILQYIICNNHRNKKNNKNNYMELKIAYLLINSNLNWQSIMISHNIHINQIISLTTIILDLIFLLDWRTLTLQLHENIMKSISYFLIKCYFTLSLFFVLLDLIIIRVGLIRIQGRSWAYYHHHSSLTYLPQICTYMSATC